MWMLTNENICWSMPSLLVPPIWLLKFAGWIKKLSYFVRMADPQVWSAEDQRTWCRHCWCMNPSRSTTHRDAWRLGRCGNGFAASWSCFLPLNLRFVKGRSRPCVGLETWIFRSNSGGLLEIIWACAKLGPDIPMKIIMKQWPAPVEKRPMA